MSRDQTQNQQNEEVLSSDGRAESEYLQNGDTVLHDVQYSPDPSTSLHYHGSHPGPRHHHLSAGCPHSLPTICLPSMAPPICSPQRGQNDLFVVLIHSTQENSKVCMPTTKALPKLSPDYLSSPGILSLE